MRRVGLIAGAVLVLAISTPPSFAVPSPVVRCTLATPVVDVTYARMPPAIHATIGFMSERDGPFQVTDVIIPGEANPSRRVIRAGRAGRDWFVWYEAGGVSYSWHASVFRVEPGAAKPRILANVLISIAWISGAWTARSDICALIDGALAGHVPPYPAGVSATTYF